MAAKKRNMKDLYSFTRKPAGKYQRAEKPVKDKQGNPLTTADDQLKCWAEHFGELLKRSAPENPPDLTQSSRTLPLNCDKPSKSEIQRAIKALKKGKAAGPDGVPAEAMQEDIATSVDILHRLFARIREEGRIPEGWRERLIVKVPKKGDLAECNNHRGIMLLSVLGKVLNSILLERMKAAVDALL